MDGPLFSLERRLNLWCFWHGHCNFHVLTPCGSVQFEQILTFELRYRSPCNNRSDQLMFSRCLLCFYVNTWVSKDVKQSFNWLQSLCYCFRYCGTSAVSAVVIFNALPMNGIFLRLSANCRDVKASLWPRPRPRTKINGPSLGLVTIGLDIMDIWSRTLLIFCSKPLMAIVFTSIQISQIHDTTTHLCLSKR